MTEHMSGDSDADDRFVRLDDGDMHVVADGKPGSARLAADPRHRGLDGVVGPGGPTARRAPAASSGSTCSATGGRRARPGGNDIPAQARRVGAALDRLGAGRVTVIGHSTGGTVATALAEQRPDAVAALALIDTGPSPDAYIDQGLLGRLLLAPFPGRLLWRLRTEAIIRKALSSAFTRPVEIPDALIEATLGMTHRALAGTGPRIPGLPQAAEPSRPADRAGRPVG